MVHFVQSNNSYPFDWENPFGYLIAVILQCLMTFNLLLYATSLLSIALGIYLFVASANEFMENDLRSINKWAKQKKSASDILELFSRFIYSHVEIKQLS